MAGILAMQAMGFPPLPGMPGFPQAGSPTALSPPSQAPRNGQRCRDYDTKGFCALGSSCPYEHGNDRIIVPAQNDGMSPSKLAENDTLKNMEEYDPANASMVDVRSPISRNGHTSPDRQFERGRGRGRGRGEGRGGFQSKRGGRADFSMAGPNYDHSNTTVVVEQIPEEKFDVQIVKDFFSEFGNVEEVTMQAYKRLALVKFADWGSAKRAYESPKVIFDNRFVKVYWYKPDSLPRPQPDGTAKAGLSASLSIKQEDTFDKEAFAKAQAEAQKIHEEKQRKRKEAEEAREALKKRSEELQRRQAEMVQKMNAKEGKASSQGSASPAPEKATENGTNGTTGKSAQTQALREKLAQLEEEARGMGIDPNAQEASAPYGRGRGRGSYRGYGGGGYAPRGRGFDPSRGSYRGWAGARGRGGASVMRLDNRPKKVAVSGAEFDSAKDEALRQYLLVRYALVFMKQEDN